MFNRLFIGKPTYIDHVYSNTANSISLKFYDSLEDRRPFGHKVMAITLHPNFSLDAGTSHSITKKVTDACKFRKLWRLERSRLRSLSQKQNLVTNHLVQELYEALTKSKKSATKVKSVNVDVAINQSFQISDIKVDSFKNPASEFYRKCRRFFKGSLFKENCDTRVDQAFAQTLKKKFDQLISPCGSFELSEGGCRLPLLEKKRQLC